MIIPQLLENLKSVPGVRYCSIKILGFINDATVIEPLEVILRDKNQEYDRLPFHFAGYYLIWE
jgi:hypothetical protein